MLSAFFDWVAWEKSMPAKGKFAVKITHAVSSAELTRWIFIWLASAADQSYLTIRQFSIRFFKKQAF